MDGYHQHNFQQKKSDTDENMLDDSIYLNIQI